MVLTAAVPLILWAAAGAVNLEAAVLGVEPPAAGMVATLVAVCAWPVAGWFAGRQSPAGFVRFAAIFWALVGIGTPLVAWAASVSEGGLMGVLYLILLALAAPLTGLTEALPSWDYWVQTVVIGAAVLGFTLAAYYVGQRFATADPE